MTSAAGPSFGNSFPRLGLFTNPGGPWTDLEAGTDWDAAGYRFFRVQAEMP